MNKDKDDDWRLTCRDQTLAFCHRGENGLDMGRAGADVLEMRVPVIFSIDADGKVYRIEIGYERAVRKVVFVKAEHLQRGAGMKTSIRYLRKQRGMTLKELSAATGITAAHLSLIERDKRDPSIQTLNKISKALEVDTEVLWWNTAEISDGKNAGYDLVRKDKRRIYHGVYNDKLIYEYVTSSTAENFQDGEQMEGYIAKIAPGSNTNPSAPMLYKTDEFIMYGIIYSTGIL